MPLPRLAAVWSYSPQVYSVSRSHPRSLSHTPFTRHPPCPTKITTADSPSTTLHKVRLLVVDTAQGLTVITICRSSPRPGRILPSATPTGIWSRTWIWRPTTILPTPASSTTSLCVSGFCYASELLYTLHLVAFYSRNITHIC